MAVPPFPARPRISLSQGRTIQHNGESCRVTFRRGLISVGCTDITPEAAEYVLAEYRKAFPPQEEVVVLQAGL